VSNTKNELLIGLQSVLRYHNAIGISEYPLNDGIESFLRKVPQVAEVSAQKQSLGAAQVALKMNPPVNRSPVKIEEIETEIVTCHACELHKQRIYPVAGHGPDKIRLLIVGDWLSADKSGNLPPGHLFGVQQDEMLGKMLVAINLSADKVFITNVIKCAVPATCQPQATHVQSCASFLRRQIVTLAPEIICTMGMVAARALLEKSQPLSRLRGQFHDYVVEKEQKIPVIATYHPTYLLQNPEMKQATWADLQLLARRLGLL